MSDSFSFPCRVVGFAPRAFRDWGFPRKGRVQSKLSWVPLQGIGAGGRELLLPLSVCCVCPSLHVAGKRVPAWCLQQCIHEGTVGSLQVPDL